MASWSTVTLNDALQSEYSDVMDIFSAGHWRERHEEIRSRKKIVSLSRGSIRSRAKS